MKRYSLTITWKAVTGWKKRTLKQWMLRIPLYAERLLKGIDDLDWPEGIKEMQRNWIGRSTGAEVDFRLDGMDAHLRVFTTRPDTLFGATYMVIAPEHPLTRIITTDEHKQNVENYIKAASLKSDLDRTAWQRINAYYRKICCQPVNLKKILSGLPIMY
jgi:leucyl-tRNA synthetase